MLSPVRSACPGPGPWDCRGAAGNWSYYLGFGYADHQLWSPDNAGATATWTFTGTAGACYSVAAYIPIEGYADNTDAGYLVSNSSGGGLASLNQNTAGGWTGLSTLAAGGNGKITVQLTDSGSAGGYTAADEMEFTRVAC